MEIEGILELLGKNYPSSLHEGIPSIKFFPDGSGRIFHAEMEAFSFSSLQELYEHLSEEIK